MKAFFLSLIFLLLGICTYSQDVLRIGYGERLPSDIVLPEGEYRSSNQGMETKITREEIVQYTYDTPGKYVYAILKDKHAKTHSCDEHSFPSSLTVLVDTVSISYLPHTIKLSRPIHKRVETEGTYLFIDVKVMHYRQGRVRMPMNAIHTAGIGTYIQARLDAANQILSSGIHTLKYHLNGVADYSGYIQFDFMTPNGNIIPIGLTNKIEE